MSNPFEEQHEGDEGDICAKARSIPQIFMNPDVRQLIEAGETDILREAKVPGGILIHIKKTEPETD